MVTNDRPIRVGDDGWEHVKIELHVSLRDLDTISKLLSWMDGFEAGGHGDLPGHFELVMLYRSLEDAIQEAKRSGQDESRKQEDGDSNPIATEQRPSALT